MPGNKRTGNEDLIPIKLEGASLRTFQPLRGRVNADGAELEEPKMALTLVVPIEAVIPVMTRLATVFRKDKTITLTLDFPEQLKLGDLKPHDDAFSQRPTLSDGAGAIPPASQNGEGDTHLGELRPIGGTAGKVAKRARKRAAPAT